MSNHLELLLYLMVLALLGAVVVARRARRESRKPRLGDADAYEGNLVVPVAGDQHSRGRSQSGPGHSGAQHGSLSHHDGGHHGGLGGHHGDPGGHHGGFGHH